MLRQRHTNQPGQIMTMKVKALRQKKSHLNKI